MAWNVIATRKCGCEIIQLHAPRNAEHGRVSERHAGPCVYHLCRICGAVPMADSEPDSLCGDCLVQKGAAS